jgi:hypothetical protein
LLGDERAGRWRLAPAGAGDADRHTYRGDSLVPEHEWHTPDGAVRLVDCIPPRGEAADVVRVVEGLHGLVQMRGEFTPRFGYGRTTPSLDRRGEGSPRPRDRTPYG